MKIMRIEVSEGLFIAGSTVVGYTATIFYQSGKLAFYGIPPSYIVISPVVMVQGLFFLISIMASELFVLFCIDPLFSRLLSRIYRQFSRLIPPNLKVRVNQWKHRVVSWRPFYVTSHRSRRIERYIAWALVSVIITWVSFVLGYSLSDARTSYVVEATHPSCIIIVPTSTAYVCADYDKSNNRFTGNFETIQLNGSTSYRHVRIIIPHNDKNSDENVVGLIWQMFKLLT